MTPKEKAKELVDKYEFVYIQNYTSMFEVKECALIAVNEMLKELKSIRINLSPGSYVSYQDYKRDLDGIQHDAISKLLFLDQVKKEIEKL